MDGSEHASDVSRRRLLQASGAAVGLSGTSAARGDDGRSQFLSRCPEATTEPGSVPCDGAAMAACADDHPETRELQSAVENTLETRYPTVGALIDDGFVPYFDLAESGEGSWSHWLNPAFVGDETVLDPERPESVLVDNRWWRPIGVMFVATRDGDALERPPAVYGRADAEEDEAEADESDGKSDGGVCSPWHSHVGLPGRFAWWYYRQAYEDAYRDGELLLPCRTPCVMHVWTYPNPEGVYAHDAPPADRRGGPPAERAGFDTDAEPGEDDLAWEHLPDDVVPATKPSDYPFDEYIS